jgi:sugar lactone lactonase YvrE
MPPKERMMETRRALSIFVSLAVLTACSTSTSRVVPQSTVVDTAHTGGKASYKIYVANVGNSTITTYKPDGTQTIPTISTGTYLFGIAVAPNGKIYALTFDPLKGPNTDGTISSYKPDGTPTSPTITVKERGYHGPVGIVVDSSGKIYVLSSEHNGSRGTVTTYKPDGTKTTPTFRTGADSSAIAIDGSGKIYITNDTGPQGKSSVTTYLPDGTPTSPTITHRVHLPAAVAVDSNGTIYVANTNNNGPDGTEAGYVTTYGSDGTGPLHSIRDPRKAPVAVATANGRFYIAGSSAYSDILKTYTLEGRRVAPTITAGLAEPSGLAIH